MRVTRTFPLSIFKRLLRRFFYGLFIAILGVLFKVIAILLWLPLIGFIARLMWECIAWGWNIL